MATIFKRQGKGPWIIHWFDHTGRRREKSSRTTDKRACERIAAQLEADNMLRREGVIDPRMDRYSQENMRPIEEHTKAYKEHLENSGRSPLTTRDFEAHLKWLVQTTKARRLSELTLDAVEGALAVLKSSNKAARTLNYRGAVAVAFMNWCVRTGRIDSNPLRHIVRQNEDEDRSYVRRVPTDGEILKLKEVTEPRGRWLWYAVAAYAGLRRAELVRLAWGDVDAKRNVLIVRRAKSRRTNEEVPLCPELAAWLAAARPTDVHPQARVFRESVTNDTRQRDFVAAGILKAPPPAKDGEKGMKGNRGTWADADGTVCDLHSLRGWLATRLARAGVPPQVCMRIMRHANYATTLRFYTKLTGEDAAKAVSQLPAPVAETKAEAVSPEQGATASEAPKMAAAS